MDFQGKSQIGGLAQDEGEGDRYCSLTSRPSHIMQHDHSDIFFNNTAVKPV